MNLFNIHKNQVHLMKIKFYKLKDRRTSAKVLTCFEFLWKNKIIILIQIKKNRDESFEFSNTINLVTYIVDEDIIILENVIGFKLLRILKRILKHFELDK